MSSFELIRSQVESRIPGALKTYERRNRDVFHTGIPAVDRYGIPKEALTEICLARDESSGKTSVLTSLAATLTQEGHFCALVDAGLFRSRRSENIWSGLESTSVDKRRAKARQQENADTPGTSIQNHGHTGSEGGFDLIAVDLSSVSEPALRKVPLTTWFRFARVIENTDSALMVLSNYPAARSCAGLTLHLSPSRATWINANTAKSLSHARLLASAEFYLNGDGLRDKQEVQSVPRPLATGGFRPAKNGFT